ncbi:MAG TPA: UDP-N-acetylmuramoyl-L-alanine--D-glutamate ligase [Rhodothermales bacterium]|nr:UDP-N-acetylmuramoyl-L-alanine--D-glutamate ligase [Rhodothermales bacterium]
MNLQDKHITVVGAARSGLSVAKLLARHGAKVFVTDRGVVAQNLVNELEQTGVGFESGGHSDRALLADWMVISPGVPTTAPLIQQALAKGIVVFSEVEVASWFCKAPIVAITGTNGKTTTTTLAGYIFEKAGHKPFVGGNIGIPFSDRADQLTNEQTVVLEVSSFQLDHIDRFKPKVSIILNITPDHLDRYQYRFENYAASKFRIHQNQQMGDYVIYNADDELLNHHFNQIVQTAPFTSLALSIEKEVSQGAFLRDHNLMLRLEGREEVLMNADEVSIRGRHNLYNSLAAAVAARVMEIRSEVIRESLSTFEGVPHRLEFVRELAHVRYYNDSKATNVNAVWYALESFEEPIILLAGGRDKGNDYGPLHHLVREKVRMVIGVGEESGHKVVSELGCAAQEARFAANMEEAVALAHQVAQAGEVVLLSPACASFDLFENYEHRGDVFKAAVLNL